LRLIKSHPTLRDVKDNDKDDFTALHHAQSPAMKTLLQEAEHQAKAESERQEVERQAIAEAERQPERNLLQCFILVFLSHYKAEAVVSARAIKDALLIKLAKQGIPLLRESVFLDSDNLKSLDRLAEAVRSSQNFIFLLSKGIFGRPWCVYELVIAVESGLHIILVDLNYLSAEKFDKGNIAAYTENYARAPGIDRQCINKLEGWGISVERVQESIARLFNEISLGLNLLGRDRIIDAEYEEIIEAMHFP